MSANPKQGVITKIEQQKRNLKRYNIYINDEYSFSIHEDVLISYRLLKGKEVVLDEIEEILGEEERKKVERMGISFLSYRPRTVKEMREYLLRKEYDSNIIGSVLEKWVQQGYLDDGLFAKQWVQERLAYKGKGRNLLREELRVKGVSQPIIERVMNECTDQEELQACVEVTRKKAKAMKDIKQYENKIKLFQFLQRRGYPFNLIQQAYNLVKEDIMDQE